MKSYDKFTNKIFSIIICVNIVLVFFQMGSYPRVLAQKIAVAAKASPVVKPSPSPSPKTASKVVKKLVPSLTPAKPVIPNISKAPSAAKNDKGPQKDKNAAIKVASYVISKNELRTSFLLVAFQNETNNGDGKSFWSYDSEAKNDLVDSAVKFSVKNRIEALKSDSMGIKLTNADTKVIDDVYVPSTVGDYKRIYSNEFSLSLRKLKMTEKDFSNEMRKLLIDYWKKQKLVKKLFANYKGDVTSKKILDYYIKNYGNTISARHILISFAKHSDDEAKALASDILKKLKAGADFSDMAKKYSEDTATAHEGGNLGEFTKGVMVKEFENAAFSLKAGQVSNLVRTKYGYHIIKVDKIIKPTINTIGAKAKQEITDILKEPKFMDYYKKADQRWIKSAQVTIIDTNIF